MQRHESNCPVAVATVTVSRLNPVLIILVVIGGCRGLLCLSFPGSTLLWVRLCVCYEWFVRNVQEIKPLLLPIHVQTKLIFVKPISVVVLPTQK